jgi:hypothetical protein
MARNVEFGAFQDYSWLCEKGGALNTPLQISLQNYPASPTLQIHKQPGHLRELRLLAGHRGAIAFLPFLTLSCLF